MARDLTVVHRLDPNAITTVEEGVEYVQAFQKAVAACRAVGAERGKTNEYAEKMVRGIRRTGELIERLPRNKGGRGKKNSTLQTGPTDWAGFLQTTNLKPSTAQNWQSVACISDEAFERQIAQIKAKDDPKAIITATPFYRLGRGKPPAPKPIETPDFPQGPWQTIVIDPPWPIQKAVLDRRPVERVGMDYERWTKEKLQAVVEDPDEFPIGKLADSRGAHVYLWVTHKFLPTGLKMFEAWGVRYECVITWYKPTAQPLWWMYNTEHCLFGKVGTLPLLKKGRPTGFRAPQQRHSHKPEEFYELVRTVSPDRRLTMFDEPREGFTHWGIQHVDAGGSSADI